MFTVPLSADDLERTVLRLAANGTTRRATATPGPTRDVGGPADRPIVDAELLGGSLATALLSRRRRGRLPAGHGARREPRPRHAHDVVARRRPGPAERAVGVPVRAAALPRQPATDPDRAAPGDRLDGAGPGDRRCRADPRHRGQPARPGAARRRPRAPAHHAGPRAGRRRPGRSASTGSSRRRRRASASPCATATTTSSTTSGTATSRARVGGHLPRGPRRPLVGRGRRDALRQPALGSERAAPRRAQLLRGRPHDDDRSVRRRRHHARAARRAGRRGHAVRDQRPCRDRVRRGAVHEPDRTP